MVRKNTDLPFGDAFSPAQLSVDDDEEELAVVLELVDEHEGDPDSFDDDVADRFFAESPDPPTRAKNVRLGIGPVGYEIVDEDFEFTELGRRLYEVRDEPDAMYDRFARHILLNLHGLKGLEIVGDLEAEGQRTTNANIKQEFRDQYDFHVDETSNHWSQMRAWMAKADLVNTRSHIYDVNRAKVEELIGVAQDDLLELEGLTSEQQAFLRALALINPDEAIRNSVVKKIAEEAYGVSIDQSNISKKTLDPLSEAGFIEWEHRSGKPNRVETTEKFDAEVLKPLLEDVSERVGVPRAVLRRSFDEILDRLDADSTHEKGVALETLAIKMGRLLGLEFSGWRVRGEATNGSEVDVVMDKVEKSFSRWQIQCKNTKSKLKSKHVAREVGITRTLQTNVLLFIARGGVSDDARQFASQVMQKENISVMFVDGDDLDKLDERPDHLLASLRSQSRRIRHLRRLNREESKTAPDLEDVEEREQKALDRYEEELSESRSNPDTSLTDFGVDGDN